MKILGIGVDIIENERIKISIKNKIFLTRIFGKKEIKDSANTKNKVNYFAKKFVAKESLVKALGTGFRNGLNFNDIEILHDNLGKPYFYLNKKLRNIIIKRFKVKNYDLFLSISDEKDYSVAFTIIQTKNVR